MDRRRSTRLSGENAANGNGAASIMPEVEPLSSTHAAMIPNSGNEATGNDGTGTGAQEAGRGEELGEPAKKKQKTAMGLNVCSFSHFLLPIPEESMSAFRHADVLRTGPQGSNKKSQSS